ncbi:hypothetical protein Van01_14480 [Micromonospora andamanensis]|uniref:Uncharacterized protein n=1 Tax=Micromonospora andamanensis TaxID=1287068 RepID=A0ABQ4HRG5_9ACTN|nr:hypothetical protein Van01_14480 [Micromonospora andamanensis]
MAITPPKAAPLAVLPSTWAAAKTLVASSPSQSPKEAAPSTIHSLRNGRMRSTERIAPYPVRSGWLPDPPDGLGGPALPGWFGAPPDRPVVSRPAGRVDWSAGPAGWSFDGDTPDDSPLNSLSMAVPPRAGPSLGTPGGTL